MASTQCKAAWRRGTAAVAPSFSRRGESALTRQAGFLAPGLQRTSRARRPSFPAPFPGEWICGTGCPATVAGRAGVRPASSRPPPGRHGGGLQLSTRLYRLSAFEVKAAAAGAWCRLHREVRPQLVTRLRMPFMRESSSRLANGFSRGARRFSSARFLRCPARDAAPAGGAVDVEEPVIRRLPGLFFGGRAGAVPAFRQRRRRGRVRCGEQERRDQWHVHLVSVARGPRVQPPRAMGYAWPSPQHAPLPGGSRSRSSSRILQLSPDRKLSR